MPLFTYQKNIDNSKCQQAYRPTRTTINIAHVCKMVHPFRKMAGKFLIKLKIYLHQRNMFTQKNFVNMIIAVLFIIAKINNPTSFNRKWINKLIEPYSRMLLSNKEWLLIQAKIWMNRKKHMLSKSRQSQKVMYCMILFYITVSKTQNQCSDRELINGYLVEKVWPHRMA